MVTWTSDQLANMDPSDKTIQEEGGVSDDTWNPLVQQFQSILNYGFASNYLTPALVLGGLDAEGEYRSIRDVPCHYHDGKGSCFKGKHCVQAHPIAEVKGHTRVNGDNEPARDTMAWLRFDPNAKVKGPPRVNGDIEPTRDPASRLRLDPIEVKGHNHVHKRIDAEVKKSRPLALERSVHYASDLPPRLDHDPSPDIMFLGKVCHVVSPLEFYVIPKETVVCLCVECGTQAKEQEFKEVTQGYSGAADLDQRLNEYMNARKRSYQVPEYDMWQLVAVRCKVDLMAMSQSVPLPFRWYRGIVLEKVVYDKDPFGSCNVIVQLLDFGPTVTVPRHEVACLPFKFISIPPMVFKCELDGIIPVGADFSSVAISYFRSAVTDQELIVTYRSRHRIKSDKYDATTVNKSRDDYLYSVELSRKDFVTLEELTDFLQDGDDADTGFDFDYDSLRQERHDFQGIQEAIAKRKLKRQEKQEQYDKIQHRSISHALHAQGYCLVPHPFPLRPMILEGAFPNLSLAGSALLSPEPDSANRREEHFEGVMRREKRRILTVITREDGYFESTRNLEHGEFLEKILLEIPGECKSWAKGPLMPLAMSDDEEPEAQHSVTLSVQAKKWTYVCSEDSMTESD